MHSQVLTAGIIFIHYTVTIVGVLSCRVAIL
jgi:hypothetical protein